ncbi:choline transporter-like protein 4 isoform X3 [Polyodon spathula]|uniref:choline transporter-like protein 4 isoform X3 n=1 Tax=Polyodon spathula TaxID=7913 RepID=UPI001B7E0053|nr:choline transporter-like protein 4 isoform X3 [Polyodon spathula]
MGKKKENDSPDLYGEPAKYDPTFNGPLHNRGCTDVICCIFFMIFIGGYLVVGVLAWLYGDPRQVIYPRNSTGVFCGFGPNQGKPYVFYFDILKCATGTNIMAASLNGLQCPTTQVCVNACPNSYWIVPLSGYFPGAKPKDVFSDKYCSPAIDLQTTTLTVDQILSKELCARFYIPSTAVFNRCIPNIVNLPSIPSNFTLPGSATVNDTASSITNATSDLFMGFNAKALGVKIFEDFTKSWYWILIGLLIAMLASLLFLLLLRFIAGVMVWLLILGVIGVIGYGIWHCYWEYSNYKASNASISAVGFTSDLSVLLRVQETWLAFLIILAVFEVILLLSLIFLRKRILIAIALIKEASRAIGHIMCALLYPLVTFVLLVICVAYWGITALYLATSGMPLYRVMALNQTLPNCASINGTESCDPSSFNASSSPCESARCMFFKYNEEGLFQQNLFNLQIYNVLGFLWCMNFVLALGQCTMAGAFASYYWAFNKPGDLPYFPVASSFIRTLRYHVGSLAFGSLILTIVQFIRIILEYLDHKFKAAQNPCIRFIMCCLKCCFWCLEKFIKFLNRNAYIMIAIYGKNFCTSAKNAFCLLMRNIVRVVVLDKVTDLLLLFGKLMVVGGVGVLAFFFFSGRIEMPSETFNARSLNYYWVQIIVIIFGPHLLSSGFEQIFFSMYHIGKDPSSLSLCTVEDLERNDGSQEKPYYMPKSLMKILNKKNKQPKESKN